MIITCHSCKKEVDLTKGVHICKPVQNHGRMVEMVARYVPKFEKADKAYLKKFGSRPVKKRKVKP